MGKLSNYRFETIAIFYSVLGICFSLFFEFALGILPCKICMWQRYLFFSILSLSLFSMITNYQVFVLLVLGTFVGLICVSTYHALIQFGFVSDPCSVPRVATMEEFWKAINSTTIPCAKITASIFGFPISLVNAISSTVIFFLLGNETLKIITSTA